MWWIAECGGLLDSVDCCTWWIAECGELLNVVDC